MTKQYENSVPCQYPICPIHSYLLHLLQTSGSFSNSETLGSTITIICPDKATSTVPLQQPFHILRLFPACSGTSRYFHLPLHYEDHTIVMNVSLDTANINAVNISSLDFRIWHDFNSNWTTPNLQKLANVPEVPVTQI